LRHIERTKFLLFMIDLANYRPLEEQYDVLKKELENFSEELGGRDFAIALTRADALGEDEVVSKTEAFLKHLGLPSDAGENKYHFETKYPLFMQEIDFAGQIEQEKPFFVAPISSVTGINIDALKFALNAAVQRGEQE
jgi:GTP-binding protein